MPDKETESTEFSEPSTAFKDDPSIENYVALRRKHPDETIEVAISAGLEWLFANAGMLKKFDIPPELVASAMDPNPVAQSELSLLLLERIIEREQAQKAGKSHLVSRQEAIGDSLVNYLINMMLDSMDWNDHLHIPRDLIVLIRHQTGGGITDWDKEDEIREMRWRVFEIAVGLGNRRKDPSIRAIAKTLGVNPTTVMRWFPDGELAKQLKKLSDLYKAGREAKKTVK